MATANADDMLSIGAVAARTGLAVSAIRFYESQSLIVAERSDSGHRRFPRSTIRRVSFIRICQGLGYRLGEIAEQLAALPDARTPNEDDWQALASTFAADIDTRISSLQELRNKLDGCIGCGCLSLKHCAIYNPDDAAERLGTGPRYLLGNSAADLTTVADEG